MTERTDFKVGEVVILAEGEYSDYRTGPLFRCLKDLNMRELAAAFFPEAPKSDWNYCGREADASTFTLWLVKNGWVEELEYIEVHCGSYGTFECCGFTGHADEE